MLPVLHICAEGEQAQAARAVDARLRSVLPALPPCVLLASCTDAGTQQLVMPKDMKPCAVLRAMHAVVQQYVTRARPKPVVPGVTRVIVWLPFEWQPLQSAGTPPAAGCWPNCLQLVDAIVTAAAADASIALLQTQAHFPAVCARDVRTGTTVTFGDVFALLFPAAAAAIVPVHAIPRTRWRGPAFKTAAIARARSVCAGAARSAYAQRALTAFATLPDPSWLPALQVIACAGLALGWWERPLAFTHAAALTPAPFGCGIDQLLCAMLRNDAHARALFALDGAVIGCATAAEEWIDARMPMPQVLPAVCARPREPFVHIQLEGQATAQTVQLCANVDGLLGIAGAARAMRWCCTALRDAPPPAATSSAATLPFTIFGRDNCGFTSRARRLCAGKHTFVAVQNAAAAHENPVFVNLCKRLKPEDEAAARAHSTVPLVFYEHDGSIQFTGGCDALQKAFPSLHE
jgi:hypothetical protein